MDTFTQDFLAYAKAKPADETYDYVSPTHCAVAQFLRDTGVTDKPHVDPCSWWAARDMANARGIPKPVQYAVHGEAGLPGECTWGQVVARLEEGLAA